MRLSEFVYELPEDLIAQEPLEDRSASRLLVLDKKTSGVTHTKFSRCIDFLQPGDLLVMNDTRVSALRIFGQRASGGAVEALLLSDEGSGTYTALMRPAKRQRPGEVIEFEGGLTADVLQDLGAGKRSISFRQPDYRERLASTGRVPLPPYVHGTISDPSRYQTVYAAKDGSAAAPTAGLHFTQDVLQQLKLMGVETATVTLSVSIDTFRPISSDDVEDHQMHGEECALSEETAHKIAECRGRVFAVGTTTVRTLESFAVEKRRVAAGRACSKLFIKPGYEFKVVDAMFTNFHLPGTTMMLLVATLAGRDGLMNAYREAVEQRYRFLSFGDSMLVI